MSADAPRRSDSRRLAAASGEILALVDRFALPPGAAERLEALLELVLTDPLAPTTVRDPIGVVRDHLADSLVALELREMRSAATVADLGAGAGFPGLPLAIALPAAGLMLVESNGRKCKFIARAATAARAGNATVVQSRVESLAEGLGALDVVTARALAPLPVVAEYAAPLLRPGGVLVAWRGKRDPDEEDAAARAAHVLGLEARAPLHVRPYPGARHRHLHLMFKVRDTPARFPRRPGMAAKRPLGGV